MNQKDVKVSFYLKTNETNAEGHCPIMGRLTVGRSECVFSAKMLAPRSLWMSGRVKGKSAETVEINRRLDELRASALAIYREQSAIREQVMAEEVKCLLLGMAFGQETLLNYFHSFIKHFEKLVGVNRTAKSARSYRNAYEHVAQFLSERLRLSDIPFSALDRSFIDKFDLYLRTERELAPSTIVLYMSRLHTVINKAIATGIITADPFSGYEPPRPERRRRYLTREELQRLMTTPLHSPRLYLIRDLFLFSCYTGISYGDMCRLTAANLETAEDGTVWIKARKDERGVRDTVARLAAPHHRQIPRYSAGREVTSHVRKRGVEQRFKTPRRCLRHRPQTDLSHGTAHLRDGNHALARRADGDGQPDVRTQPRRYDADICPGNGQQNRNRYTVAR